MPIWMQSRYFRFTIVTISSVSDHIQVHIRLTDIKNRKKGRKHNFVFVQNRRTTTWIDYDVCVFFSLLLLKLAFVGSRANLFYVYYMTTEKKANINKSGNKGAKKEKKIDEKKKNFYIYFRDLINEKEWTRRRTE